MRTPALEPPGLVVKVAMVTREANRSGCWEISGDARLDVADEIGVISGEDESRRIEGLKIQKVKLSIVYMF